jgi:uncharacterized protein (TIGR02996 family)
MPDDPAFIRTIAATPDDDAPRLVYADYLDETGEPAKIARAEFIRVQIEKSRLVPDTPRSNKLWHRERELFDWARRWRLDFPYIPGVQYGGFIRGFVDHLEVRPPQSPVEIIGTGRRRSHVQTHERSTFLDRASEAFDALPIRKLLLINVAIEGAELLFNLDGFSHLVELEISGSNTTPKILDALIARGPWPNLRRLRVADPEARPGRRPSANFDRVVDVFRDWMR